MASRRLGRSVGLATRCLILGLGLAVGLPAIAQDPETPDQIPDTTDAFTAEALARITEMLQSSGAAQPEDMVVPDDGTATNGFPGLNGAALRGGRPDGFDRSDNSGRSESPNRFESSSRFQGPSQSQNDSQRSRGRRSFRSRSDQPGSSGFSSDYSRGGGRTLANASSGTNSGLARLDYSAFSIISERNIFDPNRYPRRPGVLPPSLVVRTPRIADSLTLVGTMAYEKGSFAFFDGSRPEYQKALKLTDVIAGYKVANISPKSVTLAAGTNAMELKVGTQLRREEAGPWLLEGQPRPYVPTASPTSSSTSTNAVAATAATSSDGAPSAAESEIIKKLMQRREQE